MQSAVKKTLKHPKANENTRTSFQNKIKRYAGYGRPIVYLDESGRKRRYLGRYFAHPMMQNRRAKRDDYKSSAVRVTQRYVP
ncbi:hypothetical protein PsalMR5_02632 [Piscirickettsia salmonis]|uniref:hypothetical protein n=1 Tax=Piscirickettsia salmonis TaxID=1238 RepID=UPI0012BA869E|nr:hypothetical protein [Piscirickettsia salmonis]QGP55189.1 hypothetical protein PsalSR1_02633 [Piscirickettsia salmonis]QGP64753.1 hypothetical protein PsalMR5_02632 [Piscirickettsia salmonis]